MSILINPYVFGGGGGGGDPYWSQVASLLHFNGTDGSTTFVDQAGKTWSAAFNAQLDTSDPLFGSAALYLDGTGDGIYTAENPDFRVNDDDFTMEMAVNFAALPASGNAATLWAKWDSGELSWFWYVFNNSGTYQIYLSYSTDGSTQNHLFVNWAAARTGDYIRLAVSRNGANVRFFDEGTQVGASQNIGTAYLYNALSQIWIGNVRDSFPLNGLIDEARFTQGVGRYPANYTVEAGEFPNS